MTTQLAAAGGQTTQQVLLVDGIAGGFSGPLVGLVLVSACVSWAGYRRFRTTD